MKATLEISMYPLHEGYEEEIITFIHRLRTYKELEVLTNGMSTQVFGDYALLFEAVQEEMKTALENNKAVFVMKLTKGERTPDVLPASLKNT
jgi:uncharacterized protein YqgV (UPF0045/DUF77 family)